MSTAPKVVGSEVIIERIADDTQPGRWVANNGLRNVDVLRRCHTAVIVPDYHIEALVSR
jgi:hypothetical protein